MKNEFNILKAAVIREVVCQVGREAHFDIQVAYCLHKYRLVEFQTNPLKTNKLVGKQKLIKLETQL